MATATRLEKRIAKLERKNRLVVSLAGGLVAIVLIAAGVEQASHDTVQASSFEMIDSTGAVRAAIEMREGFPAVALYDGNRQERILLTSTVSESAVFIKDSTGTIRLGMAQFAHGGGGFAAHGPESKGAAVLYLKGRGSLSFIDQDGNLVMRMPETE